MARLTTSEQALAAIVVAHLEALGADVYQEVELMDIVAVVGAETWIIEVKATLRLSLLTQAMDRRRMAHRVYIAAPYTRHMRDVAALCSELGIGLLCVRAGDVDSTWSTERPSVRIEVESRRWNTRPVALRSRLRPQHKTHAKAGTAGGGRWSPFLDTCEQLARVVEREPGITLKAAIDGISHHYRSAPGARSSLAKWIEAGKVPGVRIESRRLYPREVKS